MATEFSSSLLEQAIIDASALKEAAIKNAETALVGKYADDIKEAVTSLLEAEDDEGLGGLGGDLGEDLGGLGGEEEAAPAGPEAGMPDAPAAHADGERLCPCPEENQEIVIDFDALRQEMEEEEADGDAMPGTDGGLGGLDEPLAPEGEEEEEEFSLEESALQQLADALAEELKVDSKSVPNGTVGGAGSTNPRDEEEQKDAAYAQARDTELADENKQLKKAVKDLEENLKKAEADKKKFAGVLQQMSERLNEVNLNNAKLLYKNRVLNSDSLNERQKTKIAEAISGARSIKEAKVIFETLQSTVQGTGSSRSPKSLSEVITKKSSPFLPRNRSERSSTTDPAKERMQRLAGIK